MNKEGKQYGNKLRVAIIGCGKMGLNHIKAVTSSEIAELAAISDTLGPSDRIAPFISDKVPFFSKPAELFASVRPDVVHIITPPATHTDLAMAALENGAHVYVEKPFTLRREEAEKVLSLAEKKGLSVCPGHQVLFQEPCRLVSASLHEIGKIVHIESYFSFRMVRKNITRADQLMDILPHPVYTLLNYLSGGQGEIRLSGTVVDPDGEIRAILDAGDVSGVLVVTLRGRPIESYLRIVGTNGSLLADFVRGIVIKEVGPGSSAVSIILAPYSRAVQAMVKTTRSFATLALKGRKNYPGLFELTEAFYSSILAKKPSPVSPAAILNTVGICETIGESLNSAFVEQEQGARKRLEELEARLNPLAPGRGEAVVTGGTGFLGRSVASKLREEGWPVHVLSRHVPPFSSRLPGVRYSKADLSRPLPEVILNGAWAVVHCAAETAGGMDEHARNSVDATTNLIEASAKAGVKRFVHISSVAVLKPGNGRMVSESSIVDAGNRGRGPYVWGKAESERIAAEMCCQSGMDMRLIRLGPLIDFSSFTPPGRLGRELGPWYAAVGSKKSKLPICEVQTAAEVILSYLNDFDSAPPVLNLLEPEAHTREGLVKRLLGGRPDLKAFWIPFFIISALSPALKLMQRIVLKSKNPIDIKSAFSAERYDTSLSEKVVTKARAGENTAGR